MRTEGNPSLRGLRVLVAEDDPANQVLIRGLLSNWECSVVLAKDGMEAVQAYRKERLDVVLMDLQMPKLDGFAATSALRKWEGKSRKRTPIIALTAHALKGNREMCLKAGMDDFVTKPIRRELLRKAIDRVLSSRESTRNGNDALVASAPSRSMTFNLLRPIEPVVPPVFSTGGTA